MDRPPHPDQLKREHIPTVEELDTMYRPNQGYLMVIPLPDVLKIGEIILPNRSIVQQCEGHVVDMGSGCGTDIGIGDCISWSANHEVRMSTESNKSFSLVPPAAVILIIKKETLLESRARRLAIP